MKEAQKLDNPVWHSLRETHKAFSININKVLFYDPIYCPFGGREEQVLTVEAIDRYAQQTSPLYVVGKKPEYSNTMIIEDNILCNQMVLDQPITMACTSQIKTLITQQHKKELLELVNVVQPGFIKKKTPDLGAYYGIYNNHQLVALAGERMKMNGYTELSAVVTHPDHTGKGFASQLIKHATDKIFDNNQTPYLHVSERNTRAIKVYEKLGFTTRRKISFWRLARTT